MSLVLVLVLVLVLDFLYMLRRFRVTMRVLAREILSLRLAITHNFAPVE
jgi:hypothetical protein